MVFIICQSFLVYTCLSRDFFLKPCNLERILLEWNNIGTAAAETTMQAFCILLLYKKIKMPATLCSICECLYTVVFQFDAHGHADDKLSEKGNGY